jgi:alkylated DNA repair dioxygenase AlkB
VVLGQYDLFNRASTLPEGFLYSAEFLDVEEEEALLGRIRSLDFLPFEFQGFVGKRRVVSFGWRYDFNGGGLKKTRDIPEFLLPSRSRAADFAGLEPDDLKQVLLTEYSPGAPIGWHKDRPVFEDVIGVSLQAPCQFRFRRNAGATWERASLIVEPRSIYLVRGPSRSEWEHSIPPVAQQRYSITFRSLKP